MAANPPLLQSTFGQNSLVPTPYPREAICLSRQGILLNIDGVRTSDGRWSAKGTLYLTNMRIVFIADGQEQGSGLVAFELPLAYIYSDKFNQPIFGANNLSGNCWPAVQGGGPAGSVPPHKFTLYFREGGVGTFLNLYYSFLEQIRGPQQAPQSHASAAASAPPIPGSGASQEEMLSRAFVDPNDPSQIYLTTPVKDSERLPTAPVYAANFSQTQHESYQDMGLRP
ncbi:g12110 [Coccomyxa viridis]|uniref:G12110 protein n=1 Tax=Coccomyxa viridis TaxID=1274662 RepID=A0ABP1GF52_9CHLO